MSKNKSVLRYELLEKYQKFVYSSIWNLSRKQLEAELENVRRKYALRFIPGGLGEKK